MIRFIIVAWSDGYLPKLYRFLTENPATIEAIESLAGQSVGLPPEERDLDFREQQASVNAIWNEHIAPLQPIITSDYENPLPVDGRLLFVEVWNPNPIENEESLKAATNQELERRKSNA